MAHLSELIHQENNERVEVMLRRHWVTFIPVVLVFFALGAVPVVAYFFMLNATSITTDVFLYPATVLIGSAYYLLLLVFFFAQFLDYHLDMWVVTNERIIDINQRGLFSRVVTELHLDLIQDVTSASHGFFAHMFNYGEVDIHSAGPLQRIEFSNVPRPHEVRNMLIQLAAADKRRHETRF